MTTQFTIAVVHQLTTHKTPQSLPLLRQVAEAHGKCTNTIQAAERLTHTSNEIFMETVTAAPLTNYTCITY